MTAASERSLAEIDEAVLQRLSELALRDLDAFFARNHETAALYQKRLLALALCQGAAAHYVRGEQGVKDFDVWAFFREHPERPFPYRRRGTADYGESIFGRHPDDTGYYGRRIDVIGRSIACATGETAASAIRQYLTRPKNQSPRLLAQRPVVLIHPPEDRGTIVWEA